MAQDFQHISCSIPNSSFLMSILENKSLTTEEPYNEVAKTSVKCEHLLLFTQFSCMHMVLNVCN